MSERGRHREPKNPPRGRAVAAGQEGPCGVADPHLGTDNWAILTVAADRGLQSLVEDSLRSRGYQTAGVASAAEALAWLQGNRADLVLLDLGLPDLTAGELIRVLADRGSTVPFMVLAGAGDERAAVEMMKRGARSCVAKDRAFPDLLLSTVAQVVGQMRRERRLTEAETALGRSDRELAIRNRIAGAFLTIADDEVYAEVLQIVLECVGSRYGVFGYIDEDGALVCPSMTREVWDQCRIPDKDIRFPRSTWGNSIWGRAITEKKALCSNDPLHVPAGHIPMSRTLAVPIVYQDRTIGLIHVANKPGRYEEEDMELLTTICAHIAPILHARLQRDRHERERRRAEEALRQAHHELEERVRERTVELSEANELLERVFATTHVSVAYMDTCFNFIRVNRAYAEEDNRTPEFFVGKNHFALYPDQEKEAVFRRVLETGEPCSVYGKPFQYPEHPERGVTYWDWGLQPVKDAGGQVEGLLLCLVNVTKREQAEQQARRHQVELAHVARLGTIREMALAIAHELNQPLCAILSSAQGCLRMMKSPTADGGEIIEAMGQVAAQAKRAGEIISHLRDFSRKREPRRSTIDMNHVVREAVGFVAAESKPGKVRMRLELAKDVPPVLGDTIQLEQVIVNLVRNGLEAMEDTPAARRELTIRTSRVGTQSVEVAVSDTGRGLDAAMAERVFEPFFSTKAEGMGIGLPLSRSIVEAHGGRLWVTSDQDGGTTFRLTLPAAQAAEQARGPEVAG